MDELSLQSLPLGFRFRPTDEELINHYLKGKINGYQSDVEIIPEIDVCKCEPWDLPDKSVIKTDDKEWFFFSPRDRKYPNGHRSNRATEAGYWKATGKDRTIKSRTPSGTSLIGMKKTLVFHRGRAPKGERTNWIMHEYRTVTTDNDDEGALGSDQGAYVLYRLFRKSEERLILSNLDEPEESGFSNNPPKPSPADAKYSTGSAEEFECKNEHNPAQFVQKGLQVIPCGNKIQPGNDHSLTYEKGPNSHPARPDDRDTDIPSAVEDCKIRKIRSPKQLGDELQVFADFGSSLSSGQYRYQNERRDGLLDAIVDPYNNSRTDPPIPFGGIQTSEEFGFHLESLAGRSTEQIDLCKDDDLRQWEDCNRVEGPCRETPVTYMQGFSPYTMHDNLASNYHLACLDQPFGEPEMHSVNGAGIDSVDDLVRRETSIRVLNEEPSHNLVHAHDMGQGTAARRIRLIRRVKVRSRSNGLVEQHSKQPSASDMNKPLHVELIAHAVRKEQPQDLSYSKILHEDKEQPQCEILDYSVDGTLGLTEKNDQDPAGLLSKQLNQDIKFDQIEPSTEQSEPVLRVRDDNKVSDARIQHSCLLENVKARSRFARLALWVMSVCVLALAIAIIYLQGIHQCTRGTTVWACT